MIKKFFQISLFLLILDQITKSVVISYFAIEKPISVYSFLNIVPIYNESTIMGYFEDPFGFGDHYKFFYFIVFLILSVGCVWTLKKMENLSNYAIQHSTVWALGFITGAGLGNAVDRMFRIGVIDFLHFNETDLAFNFADVFAYMGIFIALGLSSYIFINYKKYSQIKLF